jgi:hypothetical protein
LTPAPAKHPKPPREPWQAQKAALAAKLNAEPWSPRKRLSPDCLAGIRALHAQYPTKYTTPVLAAQFQVSPEAIRRILKSKWVPKDEEREKRMERWERRGEKIWERLVEVGVRAPKKWREMGVGQKKRRVDGGKRMGSGDGHVPWDRQERRANEEWEGVRRDVAESMDEDTEWADGGLGARIL